jgi:hypothetical protein
LPDTINISFKGMVVPVPIKAIVSESMFMDCAEVALHVADGGLQAFEDYLQQLWERAERQGVSTSAMLAMAQRRDG